MKNTCSLAMVCKRMLLLCLLAAASGFLSHTRRAAPARGASINAAKKQKAVGSPDGGFIAAPEAAAALAADEAEAAPVFQQNLVISSLQAETRAVEEAKAALAEAKAALVALAEAKAEAAEALAADEAEEAPIFEQNLVVSSLQAESRVAEAAAAALAAAEADVQVAERAYAKAVAAADAKAAADREAERAAEKERLADLEAERAAEKERLAAEAAAERVAALAAAERRVAMLGEWQTGDGEPLCVLKPGGDVAVLPSKGEGGAWTVVAEDDASSTVEITLRLNRFTRRGVYSGVQEHTLRGTIRGDAFDGTISRVFFGQETESDWTMQKKESLVPA